MAFHSHYDRLPSKWQELRSSKTQPKVTSDLPNSAPVWAHVLRVLVKKETEGMYHKSEGQTYISPEYWVKRRKVESYRPKHISKPISVDTHMGATSNLNWFQRLWTIIKRITGLKALAHPSIDRFSCINSSVKESNSRTQNRFDKRQSNGCPRVSVIQRRYPSLKGFDLECNYRVPKMVQETVNRKRFTESDLNYFGEPYSWAKYRPYSETRLPSWARLVSNETYNLYNRGLYREICRKRWVHNN